MFNLFFPKVCEACKCVLKDNEATICTLCRHDLPVTSFHLDGKEDVKKILYGRVQLEQATSLLHFSKKSIVQQLLHSLKYKGHEEISRFFGKWLGAELSGLKAYEGVDVVVPVPLHKSKQRQRGYNQVALFGKEIAKALNVAYNDKILVKTSASKTQVFKNRTKRTNNNDKLVFSIQDKAQLKDKHVLIVDDIITTGATIEACASQLHSIEGVKISLATIAIAN